MTSPPTKSTGKWPVGLMDLEKVAGFKKDVEARMEEQKEVTFKPRCNLTKKDLSFDEVIEALNDPNDEMNTNKNMDVDNQHEDLAYLIKALDNSGAGIAGPLSDRSFFDDDGDLRNNFGVRGPYLDEDLENDDSAKVDMKVTLISVIPAEFEGYLEVDFTDDEDIV